MGVAETEPGRREKRRQVTRSRIEEAAYHLFRRQGVENMGHLLPHLQGVLHPCPLGLFSDPHRIAVKQLGTAHLNQQWRQPGVIGKHRRE